MFKVTWGVLFLFIIIGLFYLSIIKRFSKKCNYWSCISIPPPPFRGWDCVPQWPG